LFQQPVGATLTYTRPKGRKTVPELPTERIRREQFGALYEENYHLILGYALRRAGGDEAADVVAETFLVAWRRLEEIPTGMEARLWLYAVARRVIANHERSQRRRERLSERVGAQFAASVEADAVPSGASAAAVAFGRLRPDERELLALVAWEGLDAREVASVCRCSRNAVRIRLHRARRRFVRELERLGARTNQDAGTGRGSGADRHHVAFVETEEKL
jgi:RNA polymerase sigma-70 factor (ECF subfamily)